MIIFRSRLFSCESHPLCLLLSRDLSIQFLSVFGAVSQAVVDYIFFPVYNCYYYHLILGTLPFLELFLYITFKYTFINYNNRYISISLYFNCFISCRYGGEEVYRQQISNFPNLRRNKKGLYR